MGGGDCHLVPGRRANAANLGEDADTTSAIAGQLAGALWGASGIPEAWLEKLAWRDRITELADRLHDKSLEDRSK